MRNTRIYTPQAPAPGASLVLEPEPSRHLARALRMGIGDSLFLFDGRGGEYAATISAVDKHAVTVSVGEALPGAAESPLAIYLGIAVSRGERMDFVIQKATELGVAGIQPLLTEHTGVKLPPDRAEKKLRHWRQVAVSACEQSGRCKLPSVHAAQSLADWLPRVECTRKFILDPRGETGRGKDAAPGSLALLVGPEGGFSDSEVSAAREQGFETLRLGPRILRTETAPLAAIAILQGRWGDMGPGGS